MRECAETDLRRKNGSVIPPRPNIWEVTRRQPAMLLHRNLTSPPSLWPGRELRKYHYPRTGSSLCRLQSGILGLA